MEDFFWRYVILYLVPPIALMAMSAPDIQITPKLVIFAEPINSQRLPTIVFLTIADLAMIPIAFALFGDNYSFFASTLVWGLIYLWFGWKMGPFLYQPTSF